MSLPRLKKVLNLQNLKHSNKYPTVSPCHLWPVPPTLLKLGGKLGDIAQTFSKRSISLNSETLDRLLGSLAVDTAKLTSLLDWCPPYSLTEGIRTTVGIIDNRNQNN